MKQTGNGLRIMKNSDKLQSESQLHDIKKHSGSQDHYYLPSQPHDFCVIGHHFSNFPEFAIFRDNVLPQIDQPPQAKTYISPLKNNTQRENASSGRTTATPIPLSLGLYNLSLMCSGFGWYLFEFTYVFLERIP